MTDITPPIAAAIRRALLKWYRREKRDLPWRNTRDPYRIWLCEIMMQQTRIDQGLPYYERFVQAFPTVHDLAAADEERVLKLWEGLGYYARARNLHKAARIVSRDLGGAFPRTVEGLMALPGVGRYTAGAVASIAYGVPAPVVDGNVKRVLARLFNLELSIDSPAAQAPLWQRAAELVPRTAPGDFNQALMELGARICVPSKPRCPECPVRTRCEAHARGTQDELPRRNARTTAPRHEDVAAVIRRDGTYLLGKRPDHGLLSGLWEFPGGPVKAGETHAAALRRIAREDLGIAVKVRGLVASVDHTYSHMKVRLSAYRCDMSGGDAEPRAHADLRWVARRDFDALAFPMVNRKFLDLVPE